MSVTETWESVALPILRAAGEHERTGHPAFDFSPEGIGIEATPQEIAAEIKRLIADDYMTGNPTKAGRGQLMAVTGVQLSGRGARAVGQWPSNDPFEALLSLLDQRLLDPSIDSETKTKLQRFRGALVDVGKNATGGVLAALIQAGAAGI